MTTMRSFEVIILSLLWLCAIPSDTAGAFGRMARAVGRSAKWTNRSSSQQRSSQLGSSQRFGSSSKLSHQNSSPRGQFSNASSAGGSGRKIAKLSNASFGSAASPKSSNAVEVASSATSPASTLSSNTPESKKMYAAEKEEEAIAKETV